MEHEMILLDADFKQVYARLTARRRASVAESLGADPVSQNTQVEILSLAPDLEEQDRMTE